jgi:hypothetical protein
MLTTVPWRGYVLAGTFQSDRPVDAAECAPPSDAIDAFVSEINSAFPRISADACGHSIRALRPDAGRRTERTGRSAARARSAAAQYERRTRTDFADRREIHDRAGWRPSTRSMRSVPKSADAIVRLERPPLPCRTRGSPTSKGDCSRRSETSDSSSIGTWSSISPGWYGTEASEVVRFAAERRALARLTATRRFLTGEILYAAEHAAREAAG